MANVDKLVCSWSGFTGAPGWSTFYCASGSAALLQPAVKSFFTALLPYLPTAIAVTVPANGETLDVDTGKMNGVWNQGTASTQNGTSVSASAMPAGILVRWTTPSFRNGRHVWGRTFIVPAAVNVYSTAGTINSGIANTINTAATTLISSMGGNFWVYSRPVYDHKVDPPVLKRAGAFAVINSSAVPTMTTYLSTRRT